MHKNDGQLEARSMLKDPKRVWGIDDTAEPLVMVSKGVRRFNDRYAEEHVYESSKTSVNISSVPTVARNGILALCDDRACRYLRLKPGIDRAAFEEAIAKLCDVDVTFPLRNGAYEFRSDDAEQRERVHAAVVWNRSVSAPMELEFIKELHVSLGHMSYRQLKEEMQRRPDDKAFARAKSVQWTVEEMVMMFPCEACCAMKIKKKPRATYSRRTPPRAPMEYVFIDASGLIRWDWSKAEPAVKHVWESIFGCWDKYALMVDVFSQRVFSGIFGRAQGEDRIGNWYKKMLTRGQRETNQKTKRVFADRGGENRLKLLTEYCDKKGIRTEWAPTGEKEPQGQVEVYMGIMWRGASTLCFHANLHPVFACFALRQFSYLLGLRPSRGQTESRFEKYYAFGRTAEEKKQVVEMQYGHLAAATFGSDAYVIVDPSKIEMHRSKVKQDGKGNTAIYLGVSPNAEGAGVFLVVDVDSSTPFEPFIVDSSNHRIQSGKFTFARDRYHYGRRRNVMTSTVMTPQMSMEPERIGYNPRTQLPMMDGCEIQLHQSEYVQPDKKEMENNEDEIEQFTYEWAQAEVVEAADSVFDESVDIGTQLRNDKSSTSSLSVSPTLKTQQGHQSIVMQAPETMEEAKRDAYDDGKTSTLQSRTSVRNRKPADHGPLVSHVVREKGKKNVKFVDEMEKRAIDKQLISTIIEVELEATARKEYVCLTLPGPANANEFNAAADLDGWIQAKNKEDDALRHRSVYTLVPLEQANEQVKQGKATMLKSRYVFTEKVNEQEEVKKKGRLVVKDIRMGPVDEENYAPVVQQRSFRLTLALMTMFKMKKRQIDYDNAFLHARMDGRTVFVEFPKGYEPPSGAKGMVMKLEKSLYGLQSAPRRWYETVSEWIIEQGWSVSRFDPCVFYRQTPNNGVMLFSLHVDDKCGGTTQHPDDVMWFEAFIKKIAEKFGIKDMGEPSYVLGVDVVHGKDELWITQHTFIKKALKEYGFYDARVDALAPEKSKDRTLGEKAMEAEARRAMLKKGEKDEDEKSRDTKNHTPELYRQLVGSLLFATRTRPDIAHAVGMLGRLVADSESKPFTDDDSAADRVRKEKEAVKRRKEKVEAMMTLNQLCANIGAVKKDQLIEDHFAAAEHLFRYLKRTMHCGLHYRSDMKQKADEIKQSDAELRVEVYSDSDFAGDVRDGKSTTGWVVLVNGMVVDWTSSKQTVVARSTTDAENNAMADAIVSAKWMHDILCEMGFSVAKPVVVWGDNNANNNIVKRQRLFDASRTPRVNYHFIVDEVHEQCSVDIQRVESSENLADIFTKAFKDQRRFEVMRDRLVNRAPVVSVASAADGD